ncbi:hypothetical protein CWC22_014780 [Pseudoalteromonas rubra]|uniref:Uncharacterized protein n=1 Tax=Pseudoalteromonas rubra TaxID=43658 RepID=A0A5S3UUS7_9GAMM|nr:hypothetical protein [Pseudoalteromonas rubra]QPB84186.1 hypothetical protein CWC22_014780 [Pseudoalteromonas rubra]
MIKPTVLLILFFLVSGNRFLSNYPTTVVKYEKSEGYHTFILAAVAGVLLHIVSFIILTVFTLCFPSLAYSIGFEFKKFVEVLMPSIASNAEILNMVSVSGVAFVLAGLAPAIIIKLYALANRNLILEAWQKDATGDKTPEFLSLAFSSASLGLPVAFTMKNRKVYIGYIIRTSAASNDLEILPIVSGYRKKEDLDLVYLVDYQPITDKISEDDKTRNSSNIASDVIAKKFAIVLPHREIVHANLHDMSQMEHFRKHRFDLGQVQADNVTFDGESNKPEKVVVHKKWYEFWKWFKRK